MDINATIVPVAPPAKTIKSANEQQNGPKDDENQAPALPFQALLDNQQPAPKNTAVNTAVDEQALNKEIVADKLAVSDKTSASPASKTPTHGENTLEQLNFTRNLRGDGVQTALQSELLVGENSSEQPWLNNLKLSLSSQIHPSANGQLAAESLPKLGAFNQKMQQLNGDLEDITLTSDKLLDKSQLVLDEQEDKPAITAFIKNEKDERRDQPLLPLDNQRDVRSKNLTADFMPLNKKVSDKEPQSGLPTFSADMLGSNGKGAFVTQSETSAFTTATTHQTSTQPISMMPTTTVAQAAAMNAPTAAPTLHLTSQLGSEAWQQQLSQHMLFFSRQGVSQAQIRLHPEELGSLNVHLRIEDNQAVMHFVSPHSHVRAAMESMMPVLRNALQESGIHLAQGSVGQDNLGNSSDNQQHNTHQHDGHIQATHATAGTVGISEANASVAAQKSVSRQGGINTFA